MVKQQTIITQYINAQDKFNTIQKTDLIKKVCSITNRQHGIYNENHIINEFCRLSEKVIQQEQGWVETQLNTSKLIQWVIIGKYDAITTENELLEVKMRQKGLNIKFINIITMNSKSPIMTCSCSSCFSLIRRVFR